MRQQGPHIRSDVATQMASAVIRTPAATSSHQYGDSSRRASPRVNVKIPCRNSSRPRTDANAKTLLIGRTNAQIAPSAKITANV